MNTELLPALASGGTERAGRCPRRTLIAGYPLGGSRSKLSLATSGSAERGDHIRAAGRERSAAARPVFRQVSVAACDIVTADVPATAIVAGGLPMLDRAAEGWDIEVLATRTGGEFARDAGLPAVAGSVGYREIRAW
jgi:thiamine biosynthesis lipoprotein